MIGGVVPWFFLPSWYDTAARARATILAGIVSATETWPAKQCLVMFRMFFVLGGTPGE